MFWNAPLPPCVVACWAGEVIHHSAVWLPHPPDHSTRHSETLIVFGTLHLERPVGVRALLRDVPAMQSGPIGKQRQI